MPTSEQGDRTPFLVFGENEVFFEEDWEMGIGGGLWSTGLAISKYFTTDHAANEVRRLRERCGRNLSVLELGSGNGFLACCFLAMAGRYIEHLVITDDKDHLPLIERTINENGHLKEGINTNVCFLEHLWGKFTSREDKSDTSVEKLVRSGEFQFDLILGSDVAYREHLYDPLIASLSKFSAPHTVSLIGVTMNDTKPLFFKKLREAGFSYLRLADYLLPVEFRGNTFGVFIIQRV